MVKRLLVKLKEASFSILPVVFIVLVLSICGLIKLEVKEMLHFILASLLLIVGIGLFNLGADSAMTPMGENVGQGLTKGKKLSLLLIVSFLLGVAITIAEPDLSVLSKQVSSIVNPVLLIVLVSVGVGMFLLIAILKVVFKINITLLLFYFYLVLFAFITILVVKGKSSMIGLSFDSGGVTTGPITVPFLMALGVGIAHTIGGKHASENSFGLIALCSIGPIIALVILGVASDGTLNEITMSSYEYNLSFLAILKKFILTAKNVFISLSILVVLFFILNFFFLKNNKRKLIQIGIGVIYTFIGLVIFLSAVEVGFMPLGYKIGTQLATKSKTIAIIVSFIMGLAVVLAEPAVHVLNKQVEEITSGMITKKEMTIALSIGVGISLGLSILKIIYDFSILYYLIPGYLLSLGLSFFVPRIYTAIAFDSGGVASGPLTSSFILPYAIGTCVAVGGDVLSDGFGIVAMVAMTPLITIQILGFKSITVRSVKEKIAMKKFINADDDQIINFM